MINSGKCTVTSNKCLANTFCPSTDETEADCKPCTQISTSGAYSCNCIDNTASNGCQLCADEKCTKCTEEQFLDNNGKCESCSVDCQTCESTEDKCTSCNKGKILNKSTNKCEDACQTNQQCSGKGIGYCDLSVKYCKPCALNCSLCISSEFCATCEPSSMNNVLTIEGKCTKQCNDLTQDKYCLGGVATDCAPDATSKCACSNQQGCATCNKENSGCDLCLAGYIKASDDKCTDCAKGYEKFGELCISQSILPGANKLSGGAITGIVIGGLAVISAAGGGLAYYIIRKAKK
ncbi:Cysteine-rich membrane protein 1 [Spironucleus salmonicida]|uniref:Cysteine-rich membrane protein 1 n=1 Tax=Spironucleus salmonicida TaxID=348837 RepID=A0A9P8LY26_9EUKA|nr:Cysteine-rich membrane protein 1 [Spironucleus salmonicida]